MRAWIVAASVLAMMGAASAATVVAVKLGDPADPKAMTMSVDKTSVKAGAVQFDVTNVSKATVHEMIVVSVKNKDEKLPVDAKKDQVDESKIKHLGEAADLDPGQMKSLTLTLKPGAYFLICNQTGHYMQGMKTNFTVTK